MSYIMTVSICTYPITVTESCRRGSTPNLTGSTPSQKAGSSTVSMAALHTRLSNRSHVYNHDNQATMITKQPCGGDSMLSLKMIVVGVTVSCCV